jgi:hypothetical protein
VPVEVLRGIEVGAIDVEVGDLRVENHPVERLEERSDEYERYELEEFDQFHAPHERLRQGCGCCAGVPSAVSRVGAAACPAGTAGSQAGLAGIM